MSKKIFRLTYLVIVLVNKTTTIGNPHINFISLDLPHDDNQKHMNPTFISLFFLPNSWLLLEKKNDEIVRNPYLVVVLVNNNIITFRNTYTKHALPNVAYATKLTCCVNQINVSFFNEP